MCFGIAGFTSISYYACYIFPYDFWLRLYPIKPISMNKINLEFYRSMDWMSEK